ncbi:MAG: DUF3987 domain-containing protein [Rhodospirillales bacterium]|nr:DUF3987 domain-containing protein [Rhodospirillales bacterium]
MSGLEQRTKGRDEGFGGAPAITAVTARSPGADAAAVSPVWPTIDGDLLDERRAAVPAFPLELLPQAWPAWVGAAARSADAPADYVAQAVLATAAGMSGTRVWICISEGWVEPLQLWLAVVGTSSTGKSPALAMVGRLVSALERERGESREPWPRRIALADPTADGVLEALHQGRHGKLLWRDGADGCFTPLKGMASARHLEDLEVSMLGSIEPDAVASQMQRGGDGLAARFLYAWPHPLPYCPLAQRIHPASDDVLLSLRRLLQLSLRARCLLSLDPSATAAFDAFLARLHRELRHAEGLEEAWLGKGRGKVACLAGLFTLMSWSASGEAEPPREIGQEAVERAVSLWSDYYRPHALAFLQRTMPTDIECRARRVVHWLRANGRRNVSKTEVRRMALAQTVNAKETDRVLARLVEAGVLRPVGNEAPAQRGRPALRWQVNPSFQIA